MTDSDGDNPLLDAGDSIIALQEILREDIEECVTALKSRPESQFHRRMLVRTVFSHIEALLHWMRLSAYEHHTAYAQTLLAQCGPAAQVPTLRNHFKITLSSAEVCLLQEQSPRVTSQGTVTTSPLYVSLARSIRFTFDAFGRSCGLDVIPDFSDHRWRQLQGAISIRNRLTHPKRAADMSVTSADIVIVKEGLEWFQDAANDAIARNAEIKHAVVAELRELNARWA